MHEAQHHVLVCDATPWVHWRALHAAEESLVDFDDIAPRARKGARA